MKKHSLFVTYLSIGEMIAFVIGFVANAYLGRTLGPTTFGLIIIGSSFLMNSLLVSDLGLKTLGLLETSKHSDTREFSFSDIFLTKFFQALLSFVIVYGIMRILYNSEQETVLRTVCFFYLLNIFFDALLIEWFYKGLQKFKTVSILRIATKICYTVGIFIFVTSSEDVVTVPVIFFITNMASVAMLFLLIPKGHKIFQLSFSIKTYGNVLKHSLPLGIGAFLNEFVIYLPPILLGKLFSDAEAGIFGAAFKILILVKVVDHAFTTVLFSSLPKMWHNNKKETEAIVQSILRFTIVISMALSLLLALSSEFVITTIYGDKYDSGSIILSIVSWFFVLTMLNSIFSYGLIGIGKKERYVRATIHGFIINIGLVFSLIYLYGIKGAGIAIVLSELVFVIAGFRQFKQFFSVRFYSPFFISIPLAGGAFTLAMLLPLPIIARGICAALLFIGTALLCKVINSHDIQLVKEKWNES